jgi:hypothetical protein
MQFDPIQYARTEQRNIERLTRAAWGVVAASGYQDAPGPEQAAKVAEWIECALRDRAIRLGQLPVESRD